MNDDDALRHKALGVPSVPIRGHGALAFLLALCLPLVAAALGLLPVAVQADDASGNAPIYQTLDELTGKRFAYVNGSVYNQRVQERLQDTTEDF